MTCDNLLCARQKFCTFPLQCQLDAPKTIADISTNSVKVHIQCYRSSLCNGTASKCINKGNVESCVFYNAINIDKTTLEPVVSDRQLVEKLCNQCKVEGLANCFFSRHLNRANHCLLKFDKPLTDRQLVEKIERGGVLLAEDLRELIERFKSYSKLQ